MPAFWNFIFARRLYVRDDLYNFCSSITVLVAKRVAKELLFEYFWKI